jgi:type III secretion protein J
MLGTMRAIVLLVAVVLAAACSTELVSNLDDRQSREVLAALGRAGIAGERIRSDQRSSSWFSVRVAGSDITRAAAVLDANGLPRPDKPGLASLYGTGSMLPSATEEKARYIDALSAEIAAHLTGVEGVIDASVIITAPSSDPLAAPDAPRPRATASVLVRIPAAGAAVNRREVQQLVAGAVEGLAADDVTVVTTRAPGPPAGLDQRLSRVGPVRVASSSKATLVAMLVGCLTTILALAGRLWRCERARLRLQRQLEADTAGRPTEPHPLDQLAA